IITNPQPSSVGMGTILFRELMAVSQGDCDAIFCCNDDLAIGVLHECKKMHISVPNQFGVFGFNDIEMAAFSEPALSSVNVNRYHMGSRAMELIFERLHNPQEKNNKQQNYISTGFELIMRNSTR
ncbi:MAG: substrate-binding domain-containing protein, partial [Colwellia sp.]|nr:substrate-binding domain-containing protein [Colwellia sp.]